MEQAITTEKPTKTGLSPEEKELAFREVESSLASLNRFTATLRKKYPEESLLKHMARTLGVHESWVRVLEQNEGGEIKLLAGPIHELGGEDARDVDATVVGNGNGHEEPARTDYTRAHATKTNYCGARDIGCKFETKGNSYGRHQQLCEYFQTRRLLEAGYQINSFEDFVKALKKENGGKLPASPDTLKATIDKDHGSYTKLLREVKQVLKKKKAS
jgi:hypothetical protein